MKRVKALCAVLLSVSLIISGCGQKNTVDSKKETSSMETVTTAPQTETQTVTTTTFKDPSEYGKVIALTFDDGPSVVTTNMVLDTLEKYDARASFFLIGNNITEGTQDTVKRTYEMGCEINSHSQTHSYMNQMTEDEIKAEMEYTDSKIEELIGVKPAFFRPPYIAVNDTMFQAIDKPFINGYGCNDWDESVSAETIAQKVIENAKDGEIILLHDAQGNDRTVEALDTIIPELQAQGYEFVTVSELFHAKGVEPQEDNMVYSNALQTTMY